MLFFDAFLCKGGRNGAVQAKHHPTTQWHDKKLLSSDYLIHPNFSTEREFIVFEHLLTLYKKKGYT